MQFFILIKKYLVYVYCSFNDAVGIASKFRVGGFLIGFAAVSASRSPERWVVALQRGDSSCHYAAKAFPSFVGLFDLGDGSSRCPREN